MVPGHILDDQDLVETLEKSKGMSEEIKKRVSHAEDTEKELNQARHKYLPVSTARLLIYWFIEVYAAERLII